MMTTELEAAIHHIEAEMSNVRTCPVFSTLLILFGAFAFSGCVTAEDFSKEEVTLVKGPLPTEDEFLEKRLLEEDALGYKSLVKDGVLYEDSDLKTYLQDVAQPFIDALGIGTRRNFIFEVLRNPMINAMAALGGYIYYYSGVFAWMENEAQLAFILAHEISHVYHRDSLYDDLMRKWLASKTKLADILFYQPMGFSNYGEVTDSYLDHLYRMSTSGFNQEQEARADLFAVEQMTKLGYDPTQAVAFVEIVMAEKERYDPRHQKDEVYFYSNHPSNEERKKSLREWIQTHRDLILQSNATQLRAKRFLEKTYRMRREDIRLNLEYGRSLHARDRSMRLLRENPNDPTTYYYSGEAHRELLKTVDDLLIQKGGEKWRPITPEEKAGFVRQFQAASVRAFRKAIRLDSRYPEPHRGLGLYYMDRKDFEKARVSFKKYLEIIPQAKDRRSILYYLKEIEEDVRIP